MFKYDFAISYAGEDKKIAEEIYSNIKSFNNDINIFYAPNEQHLLIGKDGESFFDDLFTKCTEVIVIISTHYKRKDWPRYEWDVILERSKENRFIPIKLDNTKILGLPSNIMVEYYKDNSIEIAELCIKKLLLFEKSKDIIRPTDLEKSYDNIKHLEGSVDKSFQLVADKRTRTPLSDIDVPNSIYERKYVIVESKWLNFSVIRRLVVRILLPESLSKEEIKFNIEYCISLESNREKPDALCVFAYCKDKNFDGFISIFNVALANFAPYGEWEKAEEGFSYNLPVDKFRISLEYFEGYFDPNIEKRTAYSEAEDLVKETLSKKRQSLDVTQSLYW